MELLDSLGENWAVYPSEWSDMQRYCGHTVPHGASVFFEYPMGDSRRSYCSGCAETVRQVERTVEEVQEAAAARAWAEGAEGEEDEEEGAAAKKTAEKCQYAEPQPVEIDGKRLETAAAVVMNRYSIGLYSRGDNGQDIEEAFMAEEAYLRKRYAASSPGYPVCPLHGPTVSLRAQIASDTSRVTAHLVCSVCGVKWLDDHTRF